jgi:hypothetical protein
VVMFRALKSGELFVEEGTVAVMRPGKSLCYGCYSQKSTKVDIDAKLKNSVKSTRLGCK